MTKNILISPLDWGLGHATRCIPIIRVLNELEHRVTIATDGACYALLKEEFPNNKFIKIPGYSVTYPKRGNMVWHMTKSSVKILKKIQLEHRFLSHILYQKKFDLIISDSRFGFYNKEVKSVFITHQLKIKSPVAQKLINKINSHFIQKFTEVWVPDFENIDDSLSGALSHFKKQKNNIRYIGSLSRFQRTEETPPQYDVAAIISGPEPQRTIFAKKVISQLKELDQPAIVILGLPQQNINKQEGNLRIVSHLNAIELNKIILTSKTIISRSGYTSIMDYAKLGSKAILVPTPGQTEQKHLAKYHAKKGHYVYQKQKQLDIRKGLEDIVKTTGIKPTTNEYLKKMLSEI